MEGRERPEWAAERMQVINWVWWGEQAPRLMLRPLAGQLDGCLASSAVGESGVQGQGMQNSALPHCI